MLYSFYYSFICISCLSKNEWQYELYQYITQTMHVTVGTKGPLPFYDSL